MNSFSRFISAVTLAAASAALSAAPEGYSVNSDAADGDTLHRIDLASGLATPIGDLQLLSKTGVRMDVEGLALDATGSLWGVDDESLRLFGISTTSGIVKFDGDVEIDGLSESRANDFGMTFTCTDALFISSVAAQTLYRVESDGTTTAVGGKGALGQNISALAAHGNPVELFGLGNGLSKSGEEDVEDSRSLFRIDPATGTATLIGPLGRPEVDDYYEAGLSFDSEGTLWALIDRGEKPSQILQIDTETGAGTVFSTVSGSGFESLAVAPPSGCDASEGDSNNVTWTPQDYPIPALDPLGTLLTLLALLGAGLLALHRQSH